MERKHIVAISLAIVVFLALVILGMIYGTEAYDQYGINKLVHLPLNSEVSKEADGYISGTRHTFCLMGIGVTDIGNIRIAIRGLRFDGNSSGSVVISSSSPLGSSGSTGVGARRFTEEYKDGVTTCTFGGLEFTIEQGVLKLLDREFDIADSKPQVIIVGSDGKIEDVVKAEGEPNKADAADDK
ncbi:MAG: hypothetical protein ACI8W8_000215 [Rhodothermales bacterium]|jgi:hypothetical protein